MPTHKQIGCLPTGKRVCASRSAQSTAQACGSMVDMFSFIDNCQWLIYRFLFYRNSLTSDNEISNSVKKNVGVKLVWQELAVKTSRRLKN